MVPYVGDRPRGARPAAGRRSGGASKVMVSVGMAESHHLPYAAWHAVENDYVQRKMLRAIVDKSTSLTDEQRAGILYVLNHIDESLH